MFGFQSGVPDKELSASDHRVQQTNAAVRRSTSSELKPGDEIASPMKSLARLTKATLRADEKLHNMETALESKLTELAEKSAKAEELRSKCAALRKSLEEFTGPFWVIAYSSCSEILVF